MINKKKFDLKSYGFKPYKDEIFFQILNFKNYGISNFGRVVFKKKEKLIIIKPFQLKNGSCNHYQISIHNFQEISEVFIYVITAIYFVDNPNEYSYVKHKDGDISNNNAENLEFVPKKEENVKESSPYKILENKFNLSRKDILRLNRFPKNYKQNIIDSIKKNNISLKKAIKQFTNYYHNFQEHKIKNFRHSCRIL